MHYNDVDPKHKNSSPLLILVSGAILIYTFYLALNYGWKNIIWVLLALILFARTTAPYLANKLGGSVAKSLYGGTQKFEKTPLYSQARAKEIHHDFEAAIKLYMQILEEFPQELEAYLSIYEIIGGKQKDLKKLTLLHEQAKQHITDPKQLNTLNRRYLEYKR